MSTTVTLYHTDLNGRLVGSYVGEISKLAFEYYLEAPSIVGKVDWLNSHDAHHRYIVPTAREIGSLVDAIARDRDLNRHPTGIPIRWEIEDPDIAMLFKLTFGGSL